MLALRMNMTGTYHLPECNMFGQRFGDRLPAELEADEQLCADDGDEDPALAAQLVALGVVQ